MLELRKQGRDVIATRLVFFFRGVFLERPVSTDSMYVAYVVEHHCCEIGQPEPIS